MEICSKSTPRQDAYSSSDISGATQHAILGLQVDGDATGRATVKNVLALNNLASAADGSEAIKTTAPGAIDGAIRVLIGGSVYYIPTASSAT